MWHKTQTLCVTFSFFAMFSSNIFFFSTILGPEEETWKAEHVLPAPPICHRHADVEEP